MCVFAHAIEQQQPRAHRLTRLAGNFMWIELDFLIWIWCYDVVGRWRGRPPLPWQQHQIERKKKKRSECRYLIWISRLHIALSFARVELVATLVTELAPLTTFLLLRWIAQQRLQSERVAQFLVLCLRQRRKNILCLEFLQSKRCGCLCCEQVESIVWSWEVSFFHAASSFVEIFSKLLRKRAKSFFFLSPSCWTTEEITIEVCGRPENCRKIFSTDKAQSRFLLW